MTLLDGAPHLLVFTLAIVLDVVIGEPPNRWHPVVWMGRLISTLVRLAPKTGAMAQFVFGSCIALVVPSLFAAATLVLMRAIASWPLLGVFCQALLLKTTFSIRALGAAAAQVRDALNAGDVDRARAALLSSTLGS